VASSETLCWILTALPKLRVEVVVDERDEAKLEDMLEVRRVEVDSTVLIRT
jgi:hypothetical protein